MKSCNALHNRMDQNSRPTVQCVPAALQERAAFLGSAQYRTFPISRGQPQDRVCWAEPQEHLRSEPPGVRNRISGADSRAQARPCEEERASLSDQEN